MPHQIQLSLQILQGAHISWVGRCSFEWYVSDGLSLCVWFLYMIASALIAFNGPSIIAFNFYTIHYLWTTIWSKDLTHHCKLVAFCRLPKGFSFLLSIDPKHWRVGSSEIIRAIVLTKCGWVIIICVILFFQLNNIVCLPMRLKTKKLTNFDQIPPVKPRFFAIIYFL